MCVYMYVQYSFSVTREEGKAETQGLKNKRQLATLH